jgi:hypothetical protein
VNPWVLMDWMGHKRIEETMLYVHHAGAHARPTPDDVLAAATAETDPNQRVLAVSQTISRFGSANRTAQLTSEAPRHKYELLMSRSRHRTLNANHSASVTRLNAHPDVNVSIPRSAAAAAAATTAYLSTVLHAAPIVYRLAQVRAELGLALDRLNLRPAEKCATLRESVALWTELDGKGRLSGECASRSLGPSASSRRAPEA